MSTIKKKSDVKKHYDGAGYGPGHPAINVKVYNPGWDASTIEKEFGCSHTQAEKAAEFAWDSAVTQFWDYWGDTKGDYENGLSGSSEYAFFPGYEVEAFSEGRSSGWLVIHGLPDLEEWDAVLLARWKRFAKAVSEDVKYRSSWEAIKEDIEANEWTKEGAELYNFIDTPTGVKCVADLNQHLAKCKEDFLTSGTPPENS